VDIIGYNWIVATILSVALCR